MDDYDDIVEVEVRGAAQEEKRLKNRKTSTIEYITLITLCF
jgi:hypothetical protein